METISLIPITTVDWVIASVAVAACIVQVIYYLVVMNKVSRPRSESTNSHLPPVSVIVCAKNEADNLIKFLPTILEQDYPNFEVIVVNDASTDDSDMVLSNMKIKYPQLYYTSIPLDIRFSHTKKLAVNIGIKAAKYEHLLFTDADCLPMSNQWIRLMIAGFGEQGKELVVGYSPYKKEKGMLNRFVRYETFWNGVQYLGFALMGKCYMGVGRNMAYTKSLFNKNNGFSKHIYVASGDDDLFINEVSTKTNTAVVFTPDSQTSSLAVRHFGDWLLQKARHLSTAPLYKKGNVRLLLIEPVSRQIVWVLSLYSIIFNTFVPIGAGVLFIKLLVQLIVLSRAAKKVGERKIYWASLLLDFYIPFILGYIYVRNRFRTKKIQWK